MGTTSVVPQTAIKSMRALQAAEKLYFSKSAKDGSHQDAVGTIRRGWLMVLHPPNFALSPYLRSFSAACKAQVDLWRMGGAPKAASFQNIAPPFSPHRCALFKTSNYSEVS
jgi:hypothetical protein